MSVSGIRASFLTYQSAISFAAHVGYADKLVNACIARGDAAIFVPGCVACPLWATSPRQVKRLSWNENPQRRVRGVYEFTS